MPQPLGNRGISQIDSSIQTQVPGVEGNYESAAVFTGRYPPPPLGRGYHSAPEVEKSAGVALKGSVVVDPLLIFIF